VRGTLSMCGNPKVGRHWSFRALGRDTLKSLLRCRLPAHSV
jgi:hypothetical protein